MRIPRSGGGPSAAREWVLVAAMLTVACLPAVLFGLALVIGIAAMDGPWGALAGPLALLGAGIVRGAAERRRLPGRAVRPADEPELTGLVGGVAERLGFREPLLVRVVPEVQASLGRVKTDGVRCRVLVLGLPLLRALTEAQLAAVVAHELAHENHVRDRRAASLLFSRSVLADRLVGRFRPLAPMAAPLLRASQPLVWRAETAADADAVRVAGTAATAEALRRTAVLHAAFERLGEMWWAALAQDGGYPEDFYDALDTALRDPRVARRFARAAAEEEALDPYAADGHPPLTPRVASLPRGVEPSAPYRAAPLVLRDAEAYERWCMGQLAGTEDELGDGATERRPRKGGGRDRYDPPRPVRLLDLSSDRLHELTDALGEVEDLLGLLRAATGQESPGRAVAGALDAVADGSWPRLARRLDPSLRRVPAAARPPLSRGVLTDAVSVTLATELREAGWTRAGRWLDTVLTGPDGTVVDVHELVADAVETGDLGDVRALASAAGTDTGTEEVTV